MITHKEAVLLVTTFMGCYKSVDCPLQAGDKQLWMTRGPKENQSFPAWLINIKSDKMGRVMKLRVMKHFFWVLKMELMLMHPNLSQQRAGGLWGQGHSHLCLWWSRTFLPWLGRSERLKGGWEFCFFWPLVGVQGCLGGQAPSRAQRNLCIYWCCVLFVLEMLDLGTAGKPSPGLNQREGLISLFLLIYPPVRTLFM